MSRSAVTVFYPSSAPHLAPIAAEIEQRMLEDVQEMSPAEKLSLWRAGEAIAAARAAFGRFKQRAGINPR
jgi:hypothetical protein